MLGIATDPLFGPVILFGQGGLAVEVAGDRAVALPPLNIALARDLVSRTRAARLLDSRCGEPAVNRDALDLALVKLSQLAADVPEIVELVVNPLLADAAGVLALDARGHVARAAVSGQERLAIRPYPGELEEWIELDSGRILLRPIRPEDEPQHRELLDRVTPDDIRFRFFIAKREFNHAELASFTQIDYDREMAFIATAPDENGTPHTLGVARATAAPENAGAEFAVLVRSDLKGRGLGRALLEKLIRYCRSRGTQELTGDVLSGNVGMLHLAARLGFRAELAPEDPRVTRVTLKLNPEGGRATAPA
jgi:acetyltransferase